MTVEQAVMDVIIEHVGRGVTCIPIHAIEAAHPTYQLSGRARMRGLRSRGFVQYRYAEQTNTYVIDSSLQRLMEARRQLGEKASARVAGQRRAPSSARLVPLSPGSAGRAEPGTCNDAVREADPALLEEMRKFREGL